MPIFNNVIVIEIFTLSIKNSYFFLTMRPLAVVATIIVVTVLLVVLVFIVHHLNAKGKINPFFKFDDVQNHRGGEEVYLRSVDRRYLIFENDLYSLQYGKPLKPSFEIVKNDHDYIIKRYAEDLPNVSDDLFGKNYNKLIFLRSLEDPQEYFEFFYDVTLNYEIDDLCFKLKRRILNDGGYDVLSQGPNNLIGMSSIWKKTGEYNHLIFHMH